MNLRFIIYFGSFLLVLAIVVCCISYFVTIHLLPPNMPKPEVVEPPLPEPLVPPFDEKELKPASEIWRRWENLKSETDMPVE